LLTPFSRAHLLRLGSCGDRTGLPAWKSWPSIQERAADCDPRKWLLDPYFACLLISLGITLLVALVAPPNTVDSMTYHLGRVAMWLDQRSLAHFATHVERQVALSPFAEIVVANLQALSGGDRFANLVQWSSFGLTAVALLFWFETSVAICERRSSPLFSSPPPPWPSCKHINPDGFGLRVLRDRGCPGVRVDEGRPAFRVDLGLAAGLAMLTKGTAPVFLAPFAIWAALRLIRLHRPRRASPSPCSRVPARSQSTRPLAAQSTCLSKPGRASVDRPNGWQRYPRRGCHLFNLVSQYRLAHPSTE